MPRIQIASAGRALILLAASVSVAGCATKRDVRDLQDAVDRVVASQEGLQEELRRQGSVTQDTLRNTARELVDIRGDILQRLNRIEAQLETLEELTGQNSLILASIRDQMDRLRRVGGGAPAAGGDPGAGMGQESAGTGEADATYNAAVRQFNRGSLSAARAAFQQFLTAYPNDELAPRAQYYLADIQVQEGDLEGAIQAFSEIPELYPADAKVPDALYRIGLLHIELGNTGQARAILQRVVNTYPDDPVAALAQERLAELGGLLL